MYNLTKLCHRSYFGAILNNHKATKINRILGSHTAISTDSNPPIANCVEN